MCSFRIRCDMQDGTISILPSRLYRSARIKKKKKKKKTRALFQNVSIRCLKYCSGERLCGKTLVYVDGRGNGLVLNCVISFTILYSF